jgi:hypothetical protein
MVERLDEMVSAAGAPRPALTKLGQGYLWSPLKPLQSFVTDTIDTPLSTACACSGGTRLVKTTRPNKAAGRCQLAPCRGADPA